MPGSRSTASPRTWRTHTRCTAAPARRSRSCTPRRSTSGWSAGTRTSAGGDGPDAVLLRVPDPYAPRAGRRGAGDPRRGPPEVPALLNEDPPAHRRSRDLVAKAFSARRIAGAAAPGGRDRRTELARRRSRTGGEADLVAELASPLPLRVICELIGLPTGTRPGSGLDRAAGAADLVRGERRAARDGGAGVGRVRGYLAAEIAARRDAAGTDLLTDRRITARGRGRAADRRGAHQPADLAGLRRARDDQRT